MTRYLKTVPGLGVLALIVLFLAVTITRGVPQAPKPPTLKPGPNDERIAYITARLMEDFQYSQQQFDARISEKFFDGYLETLDPRRENFLQSDIDQFMHYRTNLDVYTLGGRGRADLRPAYEIFDRFKQRLTQHAAYVDGLLKQDKLKFNNNDRFPLDRRHASWPKNAGEAQQLWRDRLRYEVLQERLGRELSSTNGMDIIPLSKNADTEIAAQIKKHYDWTLHMVTNWDSDNVLQGYLNALVHSYDPHSDYLNGEGGQTFSIEMSLSLFGIGAQLSEQDGYCTIDSLVAGGPAEKSKQLHPKDKIIAVAQSNDAPVNVVDVELPKVVSMIRGPKGTQVRLTIEPASETGSRKLVTLIRDEIKLEDSKVKAKLIESQDGNGHTNRLGIINVPSFYAPISLPGNEQHSDQNYVSADTARLIRRLVKENAQGIIVDLRNDPGGSLEEAVKFAGLFIKDGPVVLARSSDRSVNVYEDADTNIVYTGPLAVMVNRFSASASEIVAACLQDYGRSIVVGDTNSFGKGTVQNLTPLRPFVWPATAEATNDPGTVKITIRKFYRVSGASTQFKGVMPDIVLPDILNYSTEIGEMALENPLPWDTNTPASYQKLDQIAPYLSELKLRSETRVATNQEFSYIRQDIEEFRKMQADRTVSLNEQESLKERQNNSRKQKTRDAERASRPAPNIRIYDLTVENADKPGLPEPEALTTTNSDTTSAGTISNTNDVAQTFRQLEGGPTNGVGALAIVSSTNSPATTNALAFTAPKIVSAVPIDPFLEETERILQDYISVSTNRTLIANP